MTAIKLNNTLSLKDCYDMTLKMGDKVEGGWRQFYVVILAITAWGLIANVSSFAIGPKLIILFTVLTFTVHNCIALLKMYSILAILTKETYARATEFHFLVPENIALFRQASGAISFDRVRILVVGTHSLCFLVVCYIYLSRS